MTYTHFGFRDVAEEEKASLVRGVFDSVASRYDLMNDLMSAGLHRLWKNDMVAMLHPRAGMKILDVAGGTGDIAFRILSVLAHRERGGVSRGEGILAQSRQVSPHPNPLPEGEGISVTVCDINRQMLEEGRNRAIDRNILSSPSPLEGEGRDGGWESHAQNSTTPHPPTPSGFGGRSPNPSHKNQILGGREYINWLCADAESLPLPSGTFDAYTIAFGIRNVTHIDSALKEAYRVLRPGGRFLCLEFSHLAHASLQKIYDAYSFAVIPRVGKIVTGSADPYQYLIESIRRFPKQEEFAAMIRDAGFANVQYRNLTQGVVAIHSGRKL